MFNAPVFSSPRAARRVLAATLVPLLTLATAGSAPAKAPANAPAPGAAVQTAITVNAADNFGKVPPNVLGRCYSESGVGLTDPADQAQVATLGRNCLIKRWGRENADVNNRAGRLLRTLAGDKPGTYAGFKAMIEGHKKESGDKFEFLEFANEPDGFEIKPDVSYAAFKAAYTAAYDYNASAHPAVPVKVGGPGVFKGSYLRSIEEFLDRYKADKDPKKSLGFISCHIYGDLFGFSNRKVRTLKADIVSRLKARGLPENTPVFITESSCFGGGRKQANEFNDMLKQASYMAVRDYFLAKHGFTAADANFHWTTRNGNNCRKSMLDATTKEFPKPVGPGVATPYLNMLKMQLLLKANRISDGESNEDGWGLNCFATKDETGIAAMLINCQQGSSPEEIDAALTIKSLSATALNGKRIRVEKYLIDATHNHSRAGYDGKVLEKLSDQVVNFSDTFSTTEHLGKNAVELLVLTPVGAGAALPRN